MKKQLTVISSKRNKSKQEVSIERVFNALAAVKEDEYDFTDCPIRSKGQDCQLKLNSVWPSTVRTFIQDLTVYRLQDTFACASTITLYANSLSKTSNPNVTPRFILVTDEPRFLGCILNEPPPLINKKFVIATLRDPPLSDMDENGKGVGIIFDFIEILRKKFGFTYTVKVPKENIIGNKEIGVLSMVHRGEADIAAAFLPVLPENMEVAKLSFSLGEAEWVILMRRPSESANGSGLFAPFDTTVWLLILTSLILVGPAIFIIIMIRVKLCKGSETLTRVYPLDACVWFVYGALMKQGSTLSPVAAGWCDLQPPMALKDDLGGGLTLYKARNSKERQYLSKKFTKLSIVDSSRLLFATWWIFITILTSFYTANLTAFLTLSRFTLPIDDARGVAKYRYRWIGHKGFALDQMVAEVQQGEGGRCNKEKVGGATRRRWEVQQEEGGKCNKEERGRCNKEKVGGATRRRCEEQQGEGGRCNKEKVGGATRRGWEVQQGEGGRFNKERVGGAIRRGWEVQ
uniref:Ionotropic glutamate receptor C-terminal domain-containing protein n=1 Tax=Timema monikensis TaxID=170555 RepID=A0A7R9EDS3_9NEOP|nr:unnamed protein product [Timema monikensis]